MYMYDVIFKDNKNRTYTYTCYKATNVSEVKKYWEDYINKYFKRDDCKIVKVVQLLKDIN